MEIVEFEDTDNRKHKRIQFQLARAFEMNLAFTMEKVSETADEIHICRMRTVASILSVVRC